jgi:hypothetical protein
MIDDPTNLQALWRIHDAAAANLTLTEEQMRRAVRGASVDQLIALIESFSPARSAGPDWTRTFEPLVERLWAWCGDDTMAKLAAAFRARGPAWMAVANALSPEHGTQLRASLRHPAWARLPAFAIG